MKTGAIIQARVGSERYQNKVFAILNGEPILSHVVSRVKSSKVDTVVVATTVKRGDDAIARWCHQHNTQFVRGSDLNVLDRFLHAAEWCGIGLVVRICADCPLLRPDLINRLIDAWEPGIDYMSYTVGSIPGILTRAGVPELVTVEALRRSAKFAENIAEHVTWACHEALPMNAKYLTSTYKPNSRNTIDTPADLLRLVERCAKSA